MTLIKAKSLDEVRSLVTSLGVEPYRAKQLWKWLYQHPVARFEDMTDLPEGLRQRLSENCELWSLTIAELEKGNDGTVKVLCELRDGCFIETVLMETAGRKSLCLSTQVGCPLRCRFCRTGQLGYIRNLTAAEIVDQLLLVKREFLVDQHLHNLVVMGMGEPFLNTQEVVKALRLIVSPQACGISPRRVSVSTAGIVPGMQALREAALEVNLSVSLNAASEKLRSSLMPINKKYSLTQVLDACRNFPLTKRRRITFEYVLLRGVNTSPEEAEKLTRLLRGIPCKINLIPFNACAELPFEEPTKDEIEQFRQLLLDHHYTVSVRYSRGRGIQAACGQLAGHRKGA